MSSLRSGSHLALLSNQTILEEQEPNTLIIEDLSLYHGFVQLPKLVLYARNLSRDAKLLYAVLLGYAWQEQRCFPGYTRLCDDLDASENAVRKYMRELEAVHLLSQRRRGLGLSNIYTLHDLRTSKIEVQEHQESQDYKETREKETHEQEKRTIGWRTVRKNPRSAPNKEKANEEKTLVGGEPASSAGAHQNTGAAPSSPSRRTAASKGAEQPQEQPLAHIYPQVGTEIHRVLQELGGSNPDGGVKTILEALVEVAAPPVRMHDLFALGLRRLEQRQELYAIPNPTGYLIGIMRKLAGEALVKGWDVVQMRAEDEEKHAQTLRSVARAGCRSMEEEQQPDAGEVSAIEQTAMEEQDSAAQTEDDPYEAECEASQRAAEAGACYYASLPIDPQARQIWQSVLGRIQPKVSSSAFTTWFGGTKGLVFEDEMLVVQVGSSFSREHLEKRFQDLIWSAVSEQRGIETKTRYIVLPDAQEDD